MSDESVLVEQSGGIAKLTLNRPEVLNSFNDGMASRLLGLLKDAAADPAVRAVLLTGAGRAFCAGQDIAGGPVGGPNATYGEHLARTFNPIAQQLRTMDKPIVAAVNGVAAGAGANIALSCDFVIAAEEASFLQAFINIGLVPDTGGSIALPRLIGTARAAALLMLGEKLPAVRAVEIGLIYKAVPLAALAEEAGALAARLAAMPTLALGLTKRLIAAAATNTFQQQLEAEAEAQTIAGRSADHVEGVQAFRDKRKPVFTGK